MDTERPTIAAVNGAVRAGGIGLMASCDLVVVDESVDFALTEVRIGVAPAIIADLKLAPAWIGIYFGLTAVAALFSQLGCGSFIVRYGALRMSQIALLLLAVGKIGRAHV